MVLDRYFLIGMVSSSQITVEQNPGFSNFQRLSLSRAANSLPRGEVEPSIAFSCSRRRLWFLSLARADLLSLARSRDVMLSPSLFTPVCSIRTKRRQVRRRLNKLSAYLERGTGYQTPQRHRRHYG